MQPLIFCVFRKLSKRVFIICACVTKCFVSRYVQQSVLRFMVSFLKVFVFLYPWSLQQTHVFMLSVPTSFYAFCSYLNATFSVHARTFSVHARTCCHRLFCTHVFKCYVCASHHHVFRCHLFAYIACTLQYHTPLVHTFLAV